MTFILTQIQNYSIKKKNINVVISMHLFRNYDQEKGTGVSNLGVGAADLKLAPTAKTRVISKLDMGLSSWIRGWT